MPGIADADRRRAGPPRRDRPLAPGRRLRRPARRGLRQEGIWIVRRVRLRVEAFPRFGEPVTLRTFCSGVGRFSAERRTTSRARRPRSTRWRSGSGSTRAASRRGSRSGSSSSTARAPGGAARPSGCAIPSRPRLPSAAPWTFRAADVDVAGHVNNSHYWAPLEERARRHGAASDRRRDRAPRAGAARAGASCSGRRSRDLDRGRTAAPLHASIQLRRRLSRAWPHGPIRRSRSLQRRLGARPMKGPWRCTRHICRSGSPSADLGAVVVRLVLAFRENRRADARDPPRGDHRRAHRARNRRSLMTDARPRRTGPRDSRLRDLRPRRVQGLQRQLRPLRPAICCCGGWPQTWPRRSPRGGRRSGSAATSSASSSPAAANGSTRCVAAARAALSERGEGFKITASCGRRGPARARPTTRPRRCAPPTRGCTTAKGLRSSSAAAPDPRRPGPHPPRARAASSASTCAGSPARGRRSAARRSWTPRSSTRWSAPPSCTTSARSRSPTGSCTSRGRSTTPSGS